jgi:hypothetical protein
MYNSEPSPTPGGIQVEGAEAWVVERIVDDRKKNRRHQILVHWKGHPEHETTWELLAHLARSQQLVKEYWYLEQDSKVPFKFPVMARKPVSHFVAQLPAPNPIDSELDPVGVWNTIQDSEYESQNEIEYPMDTTWC